MICSSVNRLFFDISSSAIIGGLTAQAVQFSGARSPPRIGQPPTTIGPGRTDPPRAQRAGTSSEHVVNRFCHLANAAQHVHVEALHKYLPASPERDIERLGESRAPASHARAPRDRRLR